MVECPYCQREAELVTGRSIYPHRGDLFNRNFYLCAKCDAYVGCHKASRKYGDGTVPLGRLANVDLRRLKAQAHQSFDPLWRNSPVKRQGAYKWLANRLNIPAADCHIGMFDEARCKETIAVCRVARQEFL